MMKNELANSAVSDEVLFVDAVEGDDLLRVRIYQDDEWNLVTLTTYVQGLRSEIAFKPEDARRLAMRISDVAEIAERNESE